MSIGRLIHDTRKKAGIKASELAARIGRSPAVMSDIENDRLKGGISPDILIRISDVLNAPEVLLYHCEACPIRQHVMLRLFPEMNNIRKDPLAIVNKLRTELKEAIDAAEMLGDQYTRPDFKDSQEYKAVFTHAMEQIVDVERVIETFKFQLVLDHVHTQEELKGVYESQQAKVERNGHHEVGPTGTEG